MVMGLAGRENDGKAKNCRVLSQVLARYIGILIKQPRPQGFSLKK